MPEWSDGRGRAMVPLADQTRLLAYRDALSNWKTKDYIQFDLTEESHGWIRRELDGIGLTDIKRLMYEFVASGGEIDEVRETRPEWSDLYEFHHDLRFAIQDKPVYIETRLHCRTPFVPDDAWILVVNIHTP